MQILMAEAYDLLISGVMMPGLNSWEVLPKSLIASPVWDMNFASDTNATGRGMGYLLDIPA